MLIFFYAFLHPPVKDLFFKSPLIGLYTSDPLHRLSKTPLRTFPNSSVSCSNLLHERRVSAGLQEFSKTGCLSETGRPLKHTDGLVGLRARGEFTVSAGVVHEDDFFEEQSRGGVQDAVDGPQ